MTTFEKQVENALKRYHGVLTRVLPRNRTPVHWQHVGIVDRLDYMLHSTLEHVEKEETRLTMGDDISDWQRSERKAEISAYKFHAGLLAGAMIEMIDMMDKSWVVPSDKSLVVREGVKNADEKE